MMNYDDFKEYVKENILTTLPDTYSEFEVSINKTLKNNGLELDGLSIHGYDNISPVIYLNGYYEKYNDGMDLDSIMSDISKVYEKHMNHKTIPPEVTEMVGNLDMARDSIISRLVNTSQNAHMLENRPHTEFEDLSITYHIVVSKDNDGIATIPITNHIAESWDIDAAGLEEIARANMPRNNPMEFMSMQDMMKSMIMPDIMSPDMSEEQAEEMFADMFPDENQMQMYILSNQSKVNGAIWMTNPDAMEQVSEKLGGDCFVLPSSIHECIIVPKNGFSENELQNMVREVNQGQVAPDERLSDNVYAYDSKEHKLSLANKEMTFDQAKEMVKENVLSEDISTKKHSGMTH